MTRNAPAYLRQGAGVSNESTPSQSIPSAATVVQRKAGCCRSARSRNSCCATKSEADGERQAAQERHAEHDVDCSSQQQPRLPMFGIRRASSVVPLAGPQRAHDVIPARPLDGTGELRMMGINQSRIGGACRDVHCSHPLGKARQDLRRRLDRRAMRFGELFAMRGAPAANDLLGDLEVSLEPEVLPEHEPLVEAMLAEQGSGRPRRNREALVVPVERMDPRDIAEDAASSGSGAQIAPADVGEGVLLYRRPERACQELGAEAMAENRDIAPTASPASRNSRSIHGAESFTLASEPRKTMPLKKRDDLGTSSPSQGRTTRAGTMCSSRNSRR